MEEGIIKKCGTAILKGEVIAFIINIIGLIILSAIITGSSISDNSIPTLVISINTLAILIGSSIATIKLEKNGIVNGLIIGAIYIIIYLLISLIFAGNVSFSIKTILIIILGIVAGGIGGITIWKKIVEFFYVLI